LKQKFSSSKDGPKLVFKKKTFKYAYTWGKSREEKKLNINFIKNIPLWRELEGQRGTNTHAGLTNSTVSVKITTENTIRHDWGRHWIKVVKHTA
jgi:hypothetical protein